jgi:ArsR family transcriptional regulator, arsenate/arsenite/antimonite-responsive transcriptional repressor
MKMNQAVEALGSLAQGTRLAIFRLLVEAGPKGLAAGRIGEKLDLPPATLSFHLSQLARAGLAKGRQEGRFVIYTADFKAMIELVAYLTENCCGGAYCGPAVVQPVVMKGPAHEKTSRARRRA